MARAIDELSDYVVEIFDKCEERGSPGRFLIGAARDLRKNNSRIERPDGSNSRAPFERPVTAIPDIRQASAREARTAGYGIAQRRLFNRLARHTDALVLHTQEPGAVDRLGLHCA
jgi:hypothetical protein